MFMTINHLQLLCCRLLCYHQSDILFILFFLPPPGKLFSFSSSGSQLCVYFWDQTLFAYFGHFFICFLSLLVTSLWYLLFWSLLYNIFSFSSSGSQLCLLAVFETRPILVTSIYYFGHCFIISLLEELFFSISGSELCLLAVFQTRHVFTSLFCHFFVISFLYIVSLVCPPPTDQYYYHDDSCFFWLCERTIWNQ